MQADEDKEVLPVEKRKIKGHVKHVLVILPGLHEQWVIPKKFIYYMFPPAKLANGEYVPGAKEKWLETMSYVLDDIWWLCELQYHQFWSQISFEPSSMNGVKSFLHLAPLQQLYFKVDDRAMLLIYKRIKKAVFQFMKRLLRIKESDLNFMSPEKHVEIMNKNNLVPVSLLFCLCTLYGKSELGAVYEMVSHVFKYNENLKFDNCVVRSIQLFSRMKSKLRQGFRDFKMNMKYINDGEDIREAVNAYRQNLVSSIQFLANAALTISNFLYVYAHGCEVFLKHDFDFHIIRVYKKLIIPAYAEISILYGDDRRVQLYNKLISMLELTRLEFIKSFHVCLEVLLDRLSTRPLAQEVIQRFVQLMKMALRVENFIDVVNKVKNLSEYYEYIKKKCPGNVNLTTLNTVFESINGRQEPQKKTDSQEESTQCLTNGIENCIIDDVIYEYLKDNYDSDDHSGNELENDHEMESTTLSSGDSSSEYSDWSKNENSDVEYEDYLEANNNTVKSLETQCSQMYLEPVPSTSSVIPISEMQLQSAISQVKDLLPHLGDGFIAMCLRAYNMNVSAVINGILENSLPVSLKEIDFSLSIIPYNILEDVKREYEEASSNNEEKSVPPGLKELKRVEYSSYEDMYNDKREVNKVKDIYEKFRNTEEDELYNDDVDEDDEEYFFAPVEVDPEGFYTEYTSLPKHNPNHTYNPEEDSESEREEEPEKKHRNQSRNFQNAPSQSGNFNKKPLDFCENPEETRARAEHRYRVKQARNRRGPKEFVNSSYGKPQSISSSCQQESQEDKERTNRHYKNIHKSNNANHSRRFFSDRKRRQ